MTLPCLAAEGNRGPRGLALAAVLLGLLLQRPAPVAAAGADDPTLLAATGIGSAAGADPSEADGALPEDLEGVLGRGAAVPPARLRFEVHVGRREMAQGLASQAAERFRSVTTSMPGHPGGWYLLARALTQAGQLTEALEAARRAVATLDAAPGELRQGFDAAEFHQLLGAILVSTVQLEEAEAELETAVRLDPTHARAWFRLGEVRLQRGRDEAAAEALGHAARLKPKQSSVLLAQGKALLRLERLDEAGSVLEAAKGLAPDDPEVRFVLASFHRARGEFDAQEAELLEFERLKQPAEEQRLAAEAIDTRLREASVLLEAGRGPEAVPLLEAVLTEPIVRDKGFRQARTLTDLGLARGAAGDGKGAREAYRAALEDRPDSFVANYELGVLLARAGRVDEALPRLLAATAANPFHAGAHHNLGLAWGLVGRLSPALGELRKAATLDPQDLTVRQALVELEWALGHEAQARDIAALGGVILPGADQGAAPEPGGLPPEPVAGGASK